MVIDVRISIFDLLYYYLNHLVQDLPFSKSWGAVGPVFMGAIAGIATGSGGAEARVAAMTGFAVALGIFGLALVMLLLYTVMVLVRLDQNQPVGDQRIILSENSLAIEARNRRESFDWSMLTDANADERVLWMQFAGRHLRFIPTKQLASDRECEAVREMVLNRNP